MPTSNLKDFDMRFASLLFVAAAALPLCAPAHAASGYDVAPVGEPGKAIGCMAVNGDAGLAFVAVQQNLSVMMTAKGFRVGKGDAVDGTWSVDGGKERALADKADANGTVSVDLVVTKELLALFGNGTTLSATVGKNAYEFDLAGSKQALDELGACMDKNVK